MKALLVASTMALIGGCAFVNDISEQPTVRDVGQQIDANYVNQPVRSMMTRYGAPDRQMASGESMIYTWTISRVQRSGELLQCQMDAYVTAREIVANVNLSGANGACTAFTP